MKVCSKCGFEGDETLFVRRYNQCKKCMSEWRKEHRRKNKEKIKDYQVNYQKENKEKILLQKKEYHQRNKEDILAKKKEYYQAHKEEKETYNKRYNQLNRPALNFYRRGYQKTRLAIDPAFKLRRNCSRLIHHVLNGAKGNFSILDYLDFTMDELKIHLESKFDDEMSWGNYGSYWHIDHIIPQSLLPYTSMEDENFQKCWALDNLQPLEARANLKKGNKVVAQ